MDISVEDNVDEFLRELSIFDEQVISKATVRTLNETGRVVKSRAAKGVAKEIGTAQKHVTKRIYMKKAYPNKLVSVISPEHPFRFRLAHFKPRQTKQGVSAAAWGKRKLYRNTFIAKVRAGKNQVEGVFVRKGRKRLPIRQLWGGSIPRTFASKHIINQMEYHGRERFRVRLEHNLKYYEKKRMGKRNVRFQQRVLDIL